MAGLDVTIVPYKTTPDLANAVLRGDVDVAFEYYAGFQSPITGGQMAVIATTARERASNLPNVPTVDRKRCAWLRGDKLERARRAGGNA